MEFRGIAIKFSKIKAKPRRNEKPILQNKAHQLLEETKENPCDKKLLNELYATSVHLRTLMRQKEQSSEVEPGVKSKASIIQNIFLTSKNGIIAEKL